MPGGFNNCDSEGPDFLCQTVKGRLREDSLFLEFRKVLFQIPDGTFHRGKLFARFTEFNDPEQQEYGMPADVTGEAFFAREQRICGKRKGEHKVTCLLPNRGGPVVVVNHEIID